MAGDQFELSSQYYSSGEALTMGSGKGREGGCYVNTAVGFVLVLLAVAIAVGVGVIVAFAGPNKELKFTCDYPNSGGSSGAQGGADATTKAPVGDPCDKCPCTGAPTTTPTSLTSTTAITTPAPVLDVRLPTDLIPVHYNVELQPNMYEGDPKLFTFNGSVEIDLRCDKATNVIKVHINKLNVSSYSLTRKDGGAAPGYTDYTIDKERQFFVLPLDSNLEVGQVYVLRIEFVGYLADDLAGLYRSSYFDKTRNQTTYIATSQMQPTDARKTFPCFDEPGIKSNFTVTLVRKKHMISISDMRIIQQEDRGNDWVADHYETTVKMSTYLLAFIVCDFESVEMKTNRNTTVRVWARREAINQTQYALEGGVKILEYFEDYFQIPYPLPKLDMIAIPDFAAGAMENWGLITYRETALLYDPKVSSATNKQRVAVVVSHELAHQWFGNLVTPSWWDDLWLNEGFASYVEYLGVAFFEPTWNMMEQFITIDLQNVMELDGLGSSHPIYIEVNHPDEINEIFDRISYGKGATIIRMMNFFLTEDVFKSGLTDYLRDKAYDAATKDDLWAALTKADLANGGLDVKKVMDTWTLQMGYPVVTVKVLASGKLDLTQRHFLLDYSQGPDNNKYPPPFGYKWEIPFTYTTKSEANWTSNHIDWMHHTETNKELTMRQTPATGDWVIANVGQYGYYRVNYAEDNWGKLLAQLKSDHTKIGTVNRAQIIDDAFNLARSGDVADNLLPMKTTEYLSKETDYLPWDAALINLNYIQTMLKRSRYYGDYEAYILKQILPLYNLMGWNDNITAPIMEQYKRIDALGQACARGHQPCRDQALRLFSEWMNTTDPDNPDNNPIQPNLKSLVYCNAISNGGIKEWNFAFERYQQANVASEKSKLLYAMSCSRTVWILSRYLDWTLDDTKVRKQDATSTIIQISRNSIGRSLAWDFLRQNFDYIRNEYGGGSFSFSNLILGTTSSFNTQFDLEQLQAFRNKYPNMGSGTRAADQAIEKTKSNIEWMKKNEKDIGEWLQSKQ